VSELSIVVVWVVMPCDLVNGCHPEDGGSMFL
jgi:hypothetical protein